VAEKPGLIVLFGSGETSANGQKAFDWLFSQIGRPVRLAILETPAGFQPNSAVVAGQIADFVREHLPNYSPQTTLVPARKKGTSFSPDDPALLAPLDSASAVFLGPGSPTYAVRQLEGSLAWEKVSRAHRAGAGLLLASAAAIAAGAFALPVYEIYKVGEELHWHPGLDFLGAYGVQVVFVPHWNNNEGGSKLDTSRCYMGQERFAKLLDMLPPDMPVVGIDEYTSLGLDIAAGKGFVIGKGGVMILRCGKSVRLPTGDEFPLEEIGSFRMPKPIGQTALMSERDGQAVPEVVMSLVRDRDDARAQHDWAAADSLREALSALGWEVEDTPQGPRVKRA
jgi:hypothetical protein